MFVTVPRSLSTPVLVSTMYAITVFGRSFVAIPLRIAKAEGTPMTRRATRATLKPATRREEGARSLMKRGRKYDHYTMQ
jgi:hypothetical protein